MDAAVRHSLQVSVETKAAACVVMLGIKFVGGKDMNLTSSAVRLEHAP